MKGECQIALQDTAERLLLGASGRGPQPSQADLRDAAELLEAFSRQHSRQPVETSGDPGGSRRPGAVRRRVPAGTEAEHALDNTTCSALLTILAVAARMDMSPANAAGSPDRSSPDSSAAGICSPKRWQEQGAGKPGHGETADVLFGTGDSSAGPSASGDTPGTGQAEEGHSSPAGTLPTRGHDGTASGVAESAEPDAGPDVDAIQAERSMRLARLTLYENALTAVVLPLRLSLSAGTLPAPPVIDFAHGLLRTEVLDCSSRQAAAAVEAARRCLAMSAEASGADGWAAVAGDAVRHIVMTLRRPVSLLQSLDGLARVLVNAWSAHRWENGDAPPPPTGTVRYLSELASALWTSGVLEHAAQGMLLAAQLDQLLVTAEAAAGTAAAAATGAAQRLWRRQAAGDLLENVPLLLCSLYETAQMWWSAAPNAQKVLEWRLRQPLVSHAALVFGVAVLCAADGGPAYGLSDSLQRAVLRVGSFAIDSSGRPMYHAGLPLLANDCFTLPMRSLLYIGDGDQPGRRAAVTLLMRICRLAVSSAQIWAGEEEGSDSSVGARSPQAPVSAEHAGRSQPASSAGSEAACQVPRPAAWRPRALVAWDSLPRTIRGALVDIDIHLRQAGWKHRWVREMAVERWRLAARATRYTKGWSDSRDQSFLGGHLWSSSLIRAEDVTVQSVRPPPALSAALEGGLVRCMERLFRRAAEEPEGPEAEVLGGAFFCYGDASERLPWMLAYGDPRDAAALVATLGKALRHLAPRLQHFTLQRAAHRGRSRGEELFLPAGHRQVMVTCVALLRCGPEWLERAEAAASSCAAAPVAQLARMLSAAALELLPLMSRMVQQTAPLVPVLKSKDDNNFGNLSFSYVILAAGSVLCWLPLLRPECADGAAAAAVSHPGPSSSSGSPFDAGISGLQQLLTKEVGTVPLVGAALRLWGQDCVGAFSDRTNNCWGAEHLATAVCCVAGACPEELRRAALEEAEAAAASNAIAGAGAGAAGSTDPTQSGTAPGSGVRNSAQQEGGRSGASEEAGSASRSRPVPLSFWPPPLVRKLADAARARGCAGHADALTTVATQLECWALGYRGGSDALHLAHFAVSVGRDLEAMRRAFVLAAAEPPGLLRRCAHPGCANLGGDSEAELPLKGCSRCGAVGYCCRECQVAHWHAGHKAECGGSSGRD